MNKKGLVVFGVVLIGLAAGLIYGYWPTSILPTAIVVGGALAVWGIF